MHIHLANAAPSTQVPVTGSHGAEQASPETNVGPSRAATKDEAVISAEGHAAIDRESGGAQGNAAKPRGMTNEQALALGKSLQHSNPATFKKADLNGDGKLSASEARAAGLKA